MLMKNFGHPAPKINSHHATEIRPRFVLRPRRTWPILGGVQSLPQMTLRRNAFPASPVNARLSRAPRLRIAFAMLSLSRRKTQLPILPITHGIPFTKQQILLYIILLSATTLLPFCIGMSSLFYLVAALLLNTGFIVAAIHLLKQTKGPAAIKTFHYSNFYLLMLFICLLMDHSLTRST